MMTVALIIYEKLHDAILQKISNNYEKKTLNYIKKKNNFSTHCHKLNQHQIPVIIFFLFN